MRFKGLKDRGKLAIICTISPIWHRVIPLEQAVIEGACRHLVKDRFERAGMRWSVNGAQAMLDLRAVYLNGDWDDFQRFRRQQVHQKRHGSLHPSVIPEERLFGVAA